jgi:arylsulfatase A-like enzyme
MPLIAAMCAIAPAPSLAAERNLRPNIIFMLADDQGWNGLSVPMAPDMPGSRSEIFQTPNLERLAAQGVRFSNAYAPAPVCSPTRISIQTGKSPAQLHWTKAAPPEEGRRLLEPQLIKSITDSETTVGELLRQAGYATAHYGKWHIGGGGPRKHGYDEHDGDTGNEEAFNSRIPIRSTSSAWPSGPRPSWRRMPGLGNRSSSSFRGTREKGTNKDMKRKRKL